MKRTLTALLTALMLVTFLPLASPPALAEFDFDIVCSVQSSAYIGETIYWEIAQIEGGSGTYGYVLDVIKDGEPYSASGFQLSTYCLFFTFVLPGKYKLEATVIDQNNYIEKTRFSHEITVTANPNKITKVEPVSATSLKITWNKVPGVMYYILYSSTNKINWSNLGFFSGTSYTDTNLTAGTRYYYKVRYKRVGVTFAWYSPAVAAVPMGKSSITAISTPAKGQVKLAWAKATGASGYQVLMATSASGAYKPVRQLTGTTVTLTGLKSGAALYFKVRPYRRVYATTCWGAFSAYRSVRVK